MLDAIAMAGGAGGDVQDVSVQLTRGNQVQTISLARLAAEPQQNIPLRSGDVVNAIK